MNKLCFFSVNALLFFIFSGCTHNYTNTFKTNPDNPVLLEKNTPLTKKSNKINTFESIPLQNDNTSTDAFNKEKVAKPSAFDEKNKKNILSYLQNSQATKYTDQKTQRNLDEALDYCQVSQNFWQKGEFENAVEALDQAYLLILNVNTCDNPKLIQQKEDLRFMISKRILEIYSSRNIVLNGSHNEIPIVMNKHVKKEINNFTKKREKKFFIESYKRSGKYRKKMAEALKNAGLPVELSWLPLIESGFKAKALSKARALGLWQFIPSTGYKFGLKRDTYIDERLDPIKATTAAIAYLTALHNIFGDWSTVLAAYNCGEGRVLRVIRNQNVNYLDDFWDLYQRLPRETARYVPRFIATLHIVKNLELYGLDTVELHEPLDYEITEISKKIHLKNIAKTIHVSKAVLKELNPELRYDILPGDNYQLRIPKGKKEILHAGINNIPVSSPPRPAYVYHKIKNGETLSTIAKRYRTTEKKIARSNNLSKRNFIVAGKTLKIPLRGSYVPSIKRSKKTKLCSPSTHHVKKGDSLWIIARKYGTTTKKIMTHNRLKSTNLHIGQVLRIPGHSKSKKNNTKKSLETYEVKSGDSPFTIAKSFKVPLERFLRLNRLTPRSTIYPGQKLYVE